MTALQALCARAHASAIRGAVALLMTLGEGAEPPFIDGDDVRVTVHVPDGFLDRYGDWIDLYQAGAGTAPPRSAAACGAWSGVLLPAQREAARLINELFYGISTATPLPSGGYRLILICDLALHDRLALCLASLPEVATLIAEAVEDPAPPAEPSDAPAPTEAQSA